MTADPDLLAAVAEELGMDPDDPRDSAVAALAARAAGRVLAERLHEREADIHRAQDDAVEGGLGGYANRLAAQAAMLGEVADVWLPRWCGAEVVESAPSESDRTTSEGPR